MISEVNIYTAILLGKNSCTFVIYVSIAELPVLEYMYIFICTTISEHATSDQLVFCNIIRKKTHNGFSSVTFYFE